MASHSGFKKSHLIKTLLVLALLAVPISIFALSRTEKTSALPAKPNILVMMSDDQGCDQHYTTQCDQVVHMMKALSAEPGGHWINSLQTRAHGSLCCPNRASVLTGQTSAHNKQ